MLGSRKQSPSVRPILSIVLALLWALTAKSYWQGLDFDNTLQGADALPGYVEKSPSGVGYHAIGYGQHYHAYTEKFEAYASGRFFTFTGEQLSDGPLHDFSEFISSHHAKQDEHIAAVEQEVRGYSLEQLLDAVNAIPNDDLHWEVWNKIGMALWAAAGAGGRARALGAWMTFSAKSEKLFDARETLDRWEHYERSPATKPWSGHDHLVSAAGGVEGRPSGGA